MIATAHPFGAESFPVDPPPDPDYFDHEARRAELLAEQADWDRTHCVTCGRESSGVPMSGGHVQQCDSCVVGELVARVGPYVVRDYVSATAAGR